MEIVTKTQLIDIANDPDSINLSAISLAPLCFDQESADIIANAPYLVNLNFLSLRCNQICDEGIKLLANSNVLMNVKTLLLSRCGITETGVEELARAPLYQLKILQLDNYGEGPPNQITDEACRSLAETTTFVYLEQLHLMDNAIGYHGAETIIKAFPKLLELNLWGTELTKADHKKLLKLVTDMGRDKNPSLKILNNFDRKNTGFSDF